MNVLRASYSDDQRVVLYAEDWLAMIHFVVYQVPIPRDFQGNGRRTIRVSLAFDPTVRRTRAEYIGTTMNFRLLRGCPAGEVFAHFRARKTDEGKPPDIAKKFQCDLKPGPNSRDGQTLQTAAQTFAQDTENYGDECYLVVRCAGGWAEEQVVDQRFAVVVELEHQPAVRLYARQAPSSGLSLFGRRTTDNTWYGRMTASKKPRLRRATAAKVRNPPFASMRWIGRTMT